MSVSDTFCWRQPDSPQRWCSTASGGWSGPSQRPGCDTDAAHQTALQGKEEPGQESLQTGEIINQMITSFTMVLTGSLAFWTRWP